MKKLTLLLVISSACAIHSASANLISLYQFEGDTSDAVRGSLGALSLYGGTIQYNNNQFWSSPVSSGSFLFDGMTILTAPTVGPGLSAFSISTWVWFDGTYMIPGEQIVGNLGDVYNAVTGQPETGAFNLSKYESQGNIATWLNTTTGTSLSGTPIVGGYAWYHVAVTYGASGSHRIYIDGTLYGDSAATGSLVGNPNLPLMAVGGRPLYSQQIGDAMLRGYLDDLAFFDQELTDTQVGEIYTAGLAGNSVSTLGYAFGPGAAVPEPGTWAAAALLAGGAGFARWRKRTKVS